MSIISCYVQMCDHEAEFWCNCTSPATFSCKNHVANHLENSNQSHNFTPIFLKSSEGTKEAILSFLTEEKTKTDKTKENIINYFHKALYGLEDILKEILKEIDLDSTKISTYFEKVWQIQKVSSLEEDPMLSLLILQPDEAISKAKAIFAGDDNTEQLLEMNSQIDKIIKRFKRRVSKLIQRENTLKLENDGDMNFENEPKHLQARLNKYKKAIRIDQNCSDAYNCIGIILKNEKRYEEAVKYYDEAIRINPNSAIYYTNKGIVLKELDRREEAMKCYKKAIKIDPSYSNAYNWIGVIFHNQKRYEEALKYYNDAIRINPNSAIYYVNKGLALNEWGRREVGECDK